MSTTTPIREKTGRNFVRFLPPLLILFASILLIYALFILAQTLVTFAQRNAYAQGTCTITTSKLVEYTTQGQDSAGNPVPNYNFYPHFEYTVHTQNGGSYKASGYDGTDTPSSDSVSQEAIVSHYKVGATYTCWYNPSRPVQAYLLHYANISSQLRIMLILFPVGGFLLWIGIALVRR